ncbi:MAG: hypothetical protein U1F46_03830 [Marinagarivorans sp.]
MVNQLTQVAGFSGAGIRVVASPADAEVLKKWARKITIGQP